MEKGKPATFKYLSFFQIVSIGIINPMKKKLEIIENSLPRKCDRII